MVTLKHTISNTAYFNASSDEDYILQNIGKFPIRIVAAASTPGDLNAPGIMINPGESINSVLLPGNIYVIAVTENTDIVVGK